MHNLIRMDLYRMRKAKGFWVTLILAFVFALSQTPVSWLLLQLGRMLGSGTEAAQVLPSSAPLAGMISDPFPVLNAMLALLSASFFFYSDMEFGYIKNIAGQVPKKGYTVISKAAAIGLHNLVFMAAGIIGSLLGSLPFQKITFEGELMRSLMDFVLKYLLMGSLSMVVLFACTALRSKSLGTVLAVLLGSGLMFLVYSGLGSSLSNLLKLNDFALEDWMPDQMLGMTHPEVLPALAASLVTAGIFLPLSVRVFDRRDVK